MTSDPPKSRVPESVKLVKAKAATIGLFVSAVTDWAGIAAITYLISIGQMSADPWGWGIVALGGGTAAGKMFGKHGGSTTAALAVVATKIGAIKGIGL